MGMDVFGKNPKNEQGEYFRSNVWYWHPLWAYMEELHPKIAGKVKYGHSNSGDGLNARDSYALSQVLKKDIQTGVTEKYIQDFEKEKKDAPMEECPYCKKDFNHESQTCPTCKGEQVIPSSITYYHVSIDHFKQFQIFLENCGGFKIY